MTSKRLDHRNHGFTLIELIIVIVILAILAAVALPRFIGIENQAEDAVLANSLGAIRSTARIAESAAHASGFSGNGIFEVQGKRILYHNHFPVSRANDISATGPGSFQGIVTLMEVDRNLEVYFSDSTPVVTAADALNDFLILELNGKCVYYQPPQISGELPNYSSGVLTFNEVTKQCN